MADSDSIFARAGFDVTRKAKEAEAPQPTAAPAPAAKPAANMFEAAGFRTSGGAAPVNEPAANIPTPERFAETYAKQGNKNPENKSTLQQFREDIDPASLLSTGASNAVSDTKGSFAAGKALVGQGVSEMRQGNYLPSFPSTDPRSWAAGGALDTARGFMGAVTSPISGSVNAFVTNPVTQLTGNPEIGERAGFVANSLLPNKTGGKVANEIAPATRGINALVDTIGPENVPEVVAAMRANPRMTPADLSNPVRVRTQRLMAKGAPEVQDIIAKTVEDRNATRLENTNSAFTAAMGPAPNVPQMVEELKEKARAVGRDAIQPVLENAKLVDTSPVIEAIDKKLQPGVNPLLNPKSELPLSAEQVELARLKQELVSGSGEQLFDAKRLHRVQSDFGDRAYQLTQSPDPKDRLLGGQMRSMNEKLIDQIDTATGGEYRPARAKFKDAKDISAAYESGFDTLKNRSGLNGALEDSPDAFREWMKNATPEEIRARQLGTRSDIDHKINAVKNGALAGETVTKIPYNQEKLRMLFGDQEASRLIRVMEDSRREAQTSAAIVAGSKTAETAAADKFADVQKVGGGNPLTYVAPAIAEAAAQSLGSPIYGLGVLGSLAGKGAWMGGQKLKQMSDIARHREFARNALAAGPWREQTINALLSHPKVVRELKKRANALTTP